MVIVFLSWLSYAYFKFDSLKSFENIVGLQSGRKDKIERPVKTKDFPNFMWMYNNNVMQYSTYIVSNGTSKWIESMINVWSEHSKPLRAENFTAIIKLVNTGELIRVKLTQMLKPPFKECKRVFLPYDEIQFNNSEISVAIVLENDFTKSFKKYVFEGSGSKVFPYELINFQIPYKIIVQEPRK
jgi:hypothetical protein